MGRRPDSMPLRAIVKVEDYRAALEKYRPYLSFTVAADAAKPSSWRLYSGRHAADFAKLQKLGNIYPGVLGYGNTLAVHTGDTYSCCETISAGIPTAISSDGIYIDKSVRPDCLNMQQLMIPKYALRFEDFVSLAGHMA